MKSKAPSSLLLIYFGSVAAALSVIALGMTAIVQASAGLLQSGARQKTLLEVQVATSRDIRQALATPVTIPPLPPITARPARDLSEVVSAQEKRPLRKKPSLGAMNAMAMDHGAYQSAARNYTVVDRHTSY
jgi:hypothetical protein